MSNTIYLVGQITPNEPETYAWRTRVEEYFQMKGNGPTILNPCATKFNDKLNNKQVADRLSIYKEQGITILPPKDLKLVERSHVLFANMNHYDLGKPLIGSFFELAWAYLNPSTVVIGIFDGDRKKNLNAGHPFVEAAVTTWVKNEIEACKVYENFFTL